jgi:hypothetical protein
MNADDPLDYWKSHRAKVQVDDGFADRLLERIRNVSRESQPGQWRRTLSGQRLSTGIAAAILLGATVCLVRLCAAIGLVLVPAGQGY